MDGIMGLFLRIAALIIFGLCLTGRLEEAHMTRCMISGWGILIYANLEDIKEILKNDRITKHDCNRNRGAD
jgi:hypothetical protein